MSADAFTALAARLCGGLAGSEVLLLAWAGERSDFLRLNRARLRQGGRVEDARVRLELIRGQRHAAASFTAQGDPDADAARGRALVGELRAALDHLPEDPFLLYDRAPAESHCRREAALPRPGEVLELVRGAAGDLDLVGIWAAGTLERGFASSLGHRHWHEAATFNFDWSCHLQGDRAVKRRHAGSHWDPAALRARLDGCREELARMARPPEAVPRGSYRVYLAPMALLALLDILGDAFGAEALRAGRSPLQDLATGARRLAPALQLTEHHARGLVPGFTREGFLKPAAVPLVAGGAAAEPLVAARSAAEQGLAVNCDRETPESLELAPGDLSPEQAAARLGDGLWVGNLWYCNWSDRNLARITGMTRYGCFRVRGGEPGAPVRPPMRFDDSLYDLLGARLEALTDTPEALLDAGTYGGRSLASRHLPGALVDGLELTL